MAATHRVNGHNNGANGHSGSALCSVDEFTSRSYDFVVFGGGTTGLVVAARLTKNPRVTVRVIEAGENLTDDKNVSTPSLYPAIIGREKYDWCMASMPPEVVISTGVIQTPRLFELAGAGDPEVLRKAGVECVVENTRVGANFQDHVLGGLLDDLAPGIESMDALHGKEFAKLQQDVQEKEAKGPYAKPGMCIGFVSYASVATTEELEAAITDIKNSIAQTKFEQAQEGVIVDQLRDPTFANLQVFCIPCRLDASAGADETEFFGKPPEGKQQLSLLMSLEYPLSRGGVHVTSSDPLKTPQIDPGCFCNPADIKILAAGMRWMDEIANHPLVKKSLGDRELPPRNKSLDTELERIQYVRNNISTQCHLIGTAKMGEVVDDRLKVKGMNMLRVIDASMFPGYVSGNIMSTTYAVSEKGADMIREDYGY